MPMPAPEPPKIKHYDLRRGTYSVAISIGKTRQSALQEGAEEIGQILQSNPQLMPLIGPLYFRYRDFPGAKEIAEMLAKVRDKQFPGLDSGDEEELSENQARAQVQQLQQQVQILGAQMQAAMKALETEQAKQQATILKAQLDSQTTLQKAEMDNVAKVEVAKIQQETRMLMESLLAKLDAIEKQKDRAHEMIKGALDQEHEASQNEADRQQDSRTTMVTMAVPEWKAPNTEPLQMPPEGKEL